MTIKRKSHFKKGQSGNPKGRIIGSKNKVGMELRAVAQKYTQEAIDVIVQVMRDKEQTGACRLTATGMLLDRGYGRPTQCVEVEANVKTTIKSIGIPELATFLDDVASTKGGPDDKGVVAK